MALTVNKEPHPFREGLTVTELLKEKKYSWRLITVFIGETRILKEHWPSTVLADGDIVRVLHLMAGG